jgi:hypothetical protein
MTKKKRWRMRKTEKGAAEKTHKKPKGRNNKRATRIESSVYLYIVMVKTYGPMSKASGISPRRRGLEPRCVRLSSFDSC